MRLFITGGAGCLGSNLIERYLPQGCEILVIDNFATGKREVLPQTQGLKVIEGSVSDRRLVKDALEAFRPTHVIHSAAAYKNPKDWAEDASTNVLGAVHVAQAAAEVGGVERIVNFQTALCYGRPQRVPIPADHPLAPFTSYGISKTAGETYLLNSGLPVVSLRLANICAPRLAIGPIPTFYKRLKAGQACFCSETVRDFLDVSDFFELMDRVLAGRGSSGAYNVSTGVGSSIKQVFETVVEYLGLPPQSAPTTPVGPDDVAAVVLDPATTEAAFGWRAEIDFRETIRRQLAWYDRYGVNDVYSHLAPPAAATGA